MRVLLLADREPFPSVAALLDAGPFDAVIGLGDLQPSWIEDLERFKLPKFGVYGNHDESPYMKWFGMTDLHLKRKKLHGLTISGFEGCVRYRRDAVHQYTQEEATKLVRRLKPADILICHCPPAGVNDDPTDRAHTGFEGLREWVDRVRPRYVLHGHTYPMPGHLVHRVGETRVIHVSGARVVEL